MKKIFALAIALLAVANIATAQERTKTMLVNKTDGTSVEYLIPNVESVTFGESPWVSLGIGTFADAFFFEDVYNVEIQQNIDSPNEFRIVQPYYEGLVAEGYISAHDDYTGGQYFYFTIKNSGDKIGSLTISHDNLIDYEDYNSGWYYSYYGSYVWIYHPCEASTTATNESAWVNNCVLSYQNDGTTPAVVQLAPFYYMPSYGGGWNYYAYTELVLITFPDVTANVKGVNNNIATKIAKANDAVAVQVASAVEAK